jgi:ABC-2 type transport system permease protein
MLAQTWVIFQRQMRQRARTRTWLLVGSAQPILYLLLFGPLLHNIRGLTPDGGNWTQVFIPGLLVQLTIFSAGFAGFTIIQEMREGVLDRQRVTPAARLALLLGRAAGHVVTIAVQSLLLVACALPFGLHISLMSVAVSLLLIMLLALGLSTASYVVGLVLREEMSFAPLLQAVTLPVLLLSGVLLPMALAPSWLRNLSRLNPLTYSVDTIRGLFLGQWATQQELVGLGVTVSMTVLFTALSAKIFQRVTA